MTFFFVLHIRKFSPFSFVLSWYVFPLRLFDLAFCKVRDDGIGSQRMLLVTGVHCMITPFHFSTALGWFLTLAASMRVRLALGRWPPVKPFHFRFFIPMSVLHACGLCLSFVLQYLHFHVPRKEKKQQLDSILLQRKSRLRKIIKATSSGMEKLRYRLVSLFFLFLFTSFCMDSIDFVVLAVDLFRIISHRHDCHHHYHYHCQYTIIAGSQASGFSVLFMLLLFVFPRVYVVYISCSLGQDWVGPVSDVEVEIYIW